MSVVCHATLVAGQRRSPSYLGEAVLVVTKRNLPFCVSGTDTGIPRPMVRASRSTGSPAADVAWSDGALSPTQVQVRFVEANM